MEVLIIRDGEVYGPFSREDLEIYLRDGAFHEADVALPVGESVPSTVSAVMALPQPTQAPAIAPASRVPLVPSPTAAEQGSATPEVRLVTPTNPPPHPASRWPELRVGGPLDPQKVRALLGEPSPGWRLPLRLLAADKPHQLIWVRCAVVLVTALYLLEWGAPRLGQSLFNLTLMAWSALLWGVLWLPSIAVRPLRLLNIGVQVGWPFVLITLLLILERLCRLPTGWAEVVDQFVAPGGPPMQGRSLVCFLGLVQPALLVTILLGHKLTRLGANAGSGLLRGFTAGLALPCSLGGLALGVLGVPLDSPTLSCLTNPLLFGIATSFLGFSLSPDRTSPRGTAVAVLIRLLGSSALLALGLGFAGPSFRTLAVPVACVLFVLLARWSRLREQVAPS